MTAKELLEILKDELRNEQELKIVIPINKFGIGGKPYVEVERACGGIDWDDGKLFLVPKRHLTVQTDKEKAYEMAHDMLMWIATKRTVRKSYEQKLALAIFEELGIDAMKYQDILHPLRNPNT